MSVKFSKVDIAANFASANLVYDLGETLWEQDTERLKVGDGVTSYNLLPYQFESAPPIADHGALTGLGDDDHPQYLNEARGDARYFTQTQINTQQNAQDIQIANAVQRANHTGTQLASTISDFGAAVVANETNTSLTLVGNNLTYQRESGPNQVIDLSLYLDDTNLARLVSGTLNATTGVVTFTRDDSSTFTIDMSALLDNQIASEVPVTPTGNLGSSNTQDALEELQGDIDSLGTTDTSLQSQITGNDNDIATLQSEQTTQNTNIGTNQSNISSLQSSQATQDTAIGLNTAKVSADGPISTHSDVNTSGAQSGDQLTFNGSEWTPEAVLNGFTIFPIWAEESGGLSNNNSQWSFGNGSVGNIGITIPFDCELFAATLNAEIAGTSVSIDIFRDATVIGTPVFNGANDSVNFTPVPYTAGQRVEFRTNTEIGNYTDVRVCAWFRVKATAAFPTPDLNVVSSSGLTFTSTTFATVPGMTTTVTLSDVGKIEALATYSALRSGGANSEAQFRCVINGDNGTTFFDTLSAFNDTGSVPHFVNSLPAGTYTVLFQAAVDNPITITAVQLKATAVEN